MLVPIDGVSRFTTTFISVVTQCTDCSFDHNMAEHLPHNPEKTASFFHGFEQHALKHNEQTGHKVLVTLRMGASVDG